MDNRQMIERARQVMDTEIEGLRLSRDAMGDGFVQTVRLLYDAIAAGGKIIVSGVGKNLHIAEKFSATLASTGSISVVMNPIQAMHGDLGMVAENDVLVALSFSGESDEIIKLIPAVRRLGLKVIGMVGNVESTLAKLSDVVLPVVIGQEACPFGMAPTTSTTATLAVADAVAMVLIDLHNFRKENFARLHPAGAIGRALILRARDIMRTGDHLAKLREDATVMDAILAMTKSQSGSSVIVDADGKLVGIFTDGDFRRHISTGLTDLQTSVSQVMTRNPIHARDDLFAMEILRIFEKRKIDDLPIVDADNTLVGCIDIQDLPKMKVL
ncbi:MAG: KpsF/GutQ family sugar-phosphate isomerase [Kiritimatiellae bacterium]|nr:KpsF/GutQ family sugar-phosphate isomerase [Kiritimatiellia bacterium]